MSLNKRFTGDFTIESIDSDNKIIMNGGVGGVTIDTTTPTIDVVDMTAGIEYRIITLGGIDNFVANGATEDIATAIAIGTEYVISSVGTTDFTLVGAAANTVGEIFVADEVGIGDGTAIQTIFTAIAAGVGNGTVTAVSGVTILGNLTVTGTQTTVNSTDTNIVDNTIVLNSGEVGNGVDNGTGVSGIEIDRGPANSPAGIRFNETGNIWEINVGAGAAPADWDQITVGGAGIGSVYADPDPTLSNVLDVNGYAIVSIGIEGGSADIAIEPATGGNVALTTLGAGDIVLTSADAISVTSVTDLTVTSGNDLLLSATTAVKVEQPLLLANVAIPTFPADTVLGYNVLSAGVPGLAGTGLYFVNDELTDELVSKKKAIAYSIIF